MSAPVLFVGGVDSGGGAGLLRDVETARSFGADVRVAVTAVTAQNNRAVSAINAMSEEMMTTQIEAAGHVSAVKIGMLCNSAIVEAVDRALPSVPVVLDPVLRSSSGFDLITPDGIAAMIARLLPRISLLTPNVPELQVLGRSLGVSSGEVSACASAILDRGCPAVLVKGGHRTEADRSEDWLYRNDVAPRVFSSPRFNAELRGTGCMLASVISLKLGDGAELADAVQAGKAALTARFTAVA
ncbi:hydroxymethylpyrimidine/phosphomethylpyrimidine kinase [Mameliella alba]|uniref:bifunctional hydroxymethylpyrimidine kinase/phosphomethylpyrimidine kinase n=1 Tax=Mameliella alba TaxID=561184 RepID=UPI003012D210